MRVFPVGLRASKRSEVNSRSVMAGQRTIETLKLSGWEQLAEGSTTSETDDFTITTSITSPTLEHLSDTSRVKAIDVTVSSTRAGKTRELGFVTYVRRDTS